MIVIEVSFVSVPASKPLLTTANKVLPKILVFRFLDTIGMPSHEPPRSPGPKGCTATQPLWLLVSADVTLQVGATPVLLLIFALGIRTITGVNFGLI